MKALILFILMFFTLGSLSYATPAPATEKAPGAKKVGTKTPASKRQKNIVPATKKTKVITHKYKVRSGDSLYTIARKHGMRLADLERMNGLKSSRLKIGQILVVSGKVNSGKVQADEIVEESGLLISQIALPSDEGLFADSLADVGVEPIARTYLSIPYRYGAQSRKSTDCSGFVQQVFREFDIKLPRTAREQYQVGMKVDRSSLSSGDLLFFRTRARKKYPTHVGIYLGNGKMIHASSRQRKVVISDVNHPYYVKRYVGAKRTATFLPGEIDLEILARQVTGSEVDSPLASALVSDVDEVTEPVEVLTAQSLILEAGYDGGDEELGDDEGDDVDDDVEPDAEAIIPSPPMLGTLPLEVEVTANNHVTTSFSTPHQAER